MQFDEGYAMRKRVLMFLATALLFFGGFVGFLFLTTPRHRINEDTIKLIKVGMTQADVEKIFGAPAGDYSGGAVWATINDGIGREPREVGAHLDWYGEETGIQVCFDSNGK